MALWLLGRDDAGHAEVDDEFQSVVERQDEKLTAALDRFDAAPLCPLQIGVLRPRWCLEALGLHNVAACQPWCQLTPYRFDLRELWDR